MATDLTDAQSRAALAAFYLKLGLGPMTSKAYGMRAPGRWRRKG